jgi:hypothetical protein
MLRRREGYILGLIGTGTSSIANLVKTMQTWKANDVPPERLLYAITSLGTSEDKFEPEQVRQLFYGLATEMPSTAFHEDVKIAERLGRLIPDSPAMRKHLYAVLRTVTGSAVFDPEPEQSGGILGRLFGKRSG